MNDESFVHSVMSDAFDDPAMTELAELIEQMRGHHRLSALPWCHFALKSGTYERALKEDHGWAINDFNRCMADEARTGVDYDVAARRLLAAWDRQDYAAALPLVDPALQCLEAYCAAQDYQQGHMARCKVWHDAGRPKDDETMRRLLRDHGIE